MAAMAAMAAAILRVVGGRLGHSEEAVEHEAGALDESEERPAHERRASGRGGVHWAPSTVHMSLAVRRDVGALRKWRMEPPTAPSRTCCPVSSSSGEALGVHISRSPLLLIRRFSGSDGRRALARGCWLAEEEE
jgi:hypothetical protein